MVKVDRRAETLFLGVVGEVSTPILEGTPELPDPTMAGGGECKAL